MKTIIKNVYLMDSVTEQYSIVIEDKIIKKIVKGEVQETADEVIDGKGNLAMSGFYNTHCHSAMTALRGYADDYALQPWLFEKIFPAEAKLRKGICYHGSSLAIAEMLSSGTVSFSDMYFFCDETAEAVKESGIKANLCRSITTSPDMDFDNDVQVKESKDLIEKYNGYNDDQIKCEVCFHAEYTNSPDTIRRVAELGKEYNVGLQFHVSETESEHNQCIERHGMTPMALFEKQGALDLRSIAAHSVWVSDEDMDIMSRKKVNVAHCPISNAKLGSGVARLADFVNKGVNVSIGTDGASSNNRLDMIRELQFASLIQKGTHKDPTLMPARDIYKFATLNGAIAQGRLDSGEIKEGNRADIVLLNLNSVFVKPVYDNYSALCYAASAGDVDMTMVDGKVLYHNGEYKTIDIEKVRFEADNTLKYFFNK